MPEPNFMATHYMVVKMTTDVNLMVVLEVRESPKSLLQTFQTIHLTVVEIIHQPTTNQVTDRH